MIRKNSINPNQMYTLYTKTILSNVKIGLSEVKVTDDYNY